MGIRERLGDDLKTAMRGRETIRLEAIRAIRGEIQKREVDGETLDEAAIIALIKTQIKQRQDAIEMFVKGDRDELAERERLQIAAMQPYLPEALSAKALAALVKASCEAVGATSMPAMGAVMKEAQDRLKAAGKDADNRQLASLIKARLSSR